MNTIKTPNENNFSQNSLISDRAKNFVSDFFNDYFIKNNLIEIEKKLSSKFIMSGVSDGHLTINKSEFIDRFKTNNVSEISPYSFEISNLSTNEISDILISVNGIVSVILKNEILNEDSEIKIIFNFLIETKYDDFKIITLNYSIPVDKTRNFRNIYAFLFEEFNIKKLKRELEEKNRILRKLNNEILAGEARYKFAMEATNDLVFEFDLDSNSFSVDRKKFSKIYGFNFLTFDINDLLEQICSIIHEDDFDNFKNLFAPRTIEEWKEISHNPLSLDYRVKDSSDCYRWSKMTIIPICDINGNVSKLVGSTKNIDEIKRKQEEIMSLSRRDPLTKLLNRIQTEKEINSYFCNYSSKKTPSPSARSKFGVLMMLDIDNFKSINDTYGHLAGDRLIVDVGKRIKSCTRKNDIVGRVGGDEFVVFYKFFDGVDDMNEFSENDNSFIDFINKKSAEILKSMQSPLEDDLKAHKCEFTVTLGISYSPIHGTNYNQLIECADKALYIVKKSGKNGSLICD